MANSLCYFGYKLDGKVVVVVPAAAVAVARTTSFLSLAPSNEERLGASEDEVDLDVSSVDSGSSRRWRKWSSFLG